MEDGSTSVSFGLIRLASSLLCECATRNLLVNPTARERNVHRDLDGKEGR